ncbi:unnamed protein product [Umbelopsis vinacea]
MQPGHINKRWWKEAVVYQIYPASFLDTNNDGVGDIGGVLSKLDHIKSLGANAIWLSPIYASPQKDMGYDVADYRAIHEPYGTLEQVEQLIEELHARSMRLIMDLVVNHTSDQHAWFINSRSSRQSSKRDWYFWRDPKYDASGMRQPPNNWRSIFGGSAWTYDQSTDQYYLSLFLPSQPDLNWDNEAVRQAVYSDIEFWLDKGVDGFRIDSMNLMSKHPDLPDAPIIFPEEKYQPGDKWFASGPRMHEYLQEMRKVFDKYDAMTVGELGFTKDAKSVLEYVSESRHELNMVFTGDIVDMDFGKEGKYLRDDFHPDKLRVIINKWQTVLAENGGWNAVYMDNHDSGRSLSRFGSDLPKHRAHAAKMLAIHLCSVSGTLFLLQGQEIGMANIPRDWTIKDYIDVEGRNYYNSVLEARGGDASKMQDVLDQLRLKARDNGRLPMQWDSSPNAGFTSSETKPWMRVNDDYTLWNVESQVNDYQSVLCFWKKILGIRKEYLDLFVYGTFEPIPRETYGENIIAYKRQDYLGNQKALVLLNFSDTESQVPFDVGNTWRVLLSNFEDCDCTNGKIVLHPYHGVILCNWS